MRAFSRPPVGRAFAKRVHGNAVSEAGFGESWLRRVPPCEAANLMRYRGVTAIYLQQPANR